jgi:hypothetical protein
MNALKRTATLSLLLAAFTMTSALAIEKPTCLPQDNRASFIASRNDTDWYMWVTVYRYNPWSLNFRTAEGAWCVAPHQRDEHGLHTVLAEVLFQWSPGRCQTEPYKVSHQWSFDNCKGNRWEYVWVSNPQGIYLRDLKRF